MVPLPSRPVIVSGASTSSIRPIIVSGASNSSFITEESRGDLVKLTGLKYDTKLDGLTRRIDRYHKMKNRFQVQLVWEGGAFISGVFVGVRPKNLRLVTHEDEDHFDCVIANPCNVDVACDDTAAPVLIQSDEDSSDDNSDDEEDLDSVADVYFEDAANDKHTDTVSATNSPTSATDKVSNPTFPATYGFLLGSHATVVSTADSGEDWDGLSSQHTAVRGSASASHTIRLPAIVRQLLMNPAAHAIPASSEPSLPVVDADLGTTDHMFPDLCAFITYQVESSLRIKMGNNEYIPVRGRGTAIIELNGKKGLVHNALHVPGLRMPLYSLRAHLDQSGCCFIGLLATSISDKIMCVCFPKIALQVNFSKDCYLSYKPMGSTVDPLELDYNHPKHCRVTAACTASTGVGITPSTISSILSIS